MVTRWIIQLPLPLEPWPRLPFNDGLEEVLRRHVDLAVELHRRELDEPLLSRRQLPFRVRPAGTDENQKSSINSLVSEIFQL